FPEAWLVLRGEAQSAHPLRALPEVQVRDDESGWPAVRRLQGRTFIPIGDEGLPVDDIAERQVGGVAADRVRDHEAGGRVDLDVLQQGVDADARPDGVQLGPLRDAADVDGPLPRRKGAELRPVPADRLTNEPVDGERPAVERNVRRWTR